MDYIDFFSGIGGFSEAAKRAGLKFDNHYFSEIDRYAIAAYKKNFPDAESLGDIRRIISLLRHNRCGPDIEMVTKFYNGEKFNGEKSKTEWIVSGGFPCENISVAGKGEGIYGSRSGLWFAMRRAIGILRPRFVVAENVGAITVRGLDVVIASLNEIGYDCEHQDIRASDIGALHKRERIWIVAYPRGSIDVNVFDFGGEDKSHLIAEIINGEVMESQTLFPMKLRKMPKSGRMTAGKIYRTPTLMNHVRNKSRLWPAPLSVAVKEFPTPTVPGGGRVIPDDAEWSGMAAYKKDGKKLQVGLESAVRKWPTPVSEDAEHCGGTEGNKDRDMLCEAVIKWPTPHANCGTGPGRHGTGGPNLQTKVANRDKFPTPTSRDWKDGTNAGDNCAQGANALLGRTVGPSKESGSLNPAWVELLMGFSLNWTDLESETTDRIPTAETWADGSWEEGVPRVSKGVKNRNARLRCLGKAIVPHCAKLIFRRIKEILEMQ